MYYNFYTVSGEIWNLSVLFIMYFNLFLPFICLLQLTTTNLPHCYISYSKRCYLRLIQLNLLLVQFPKVFYYFHHIYQACIHLVCLRYWKSIFFSLLIYWSILLWLTNFVSWCFFWGPLLAHDSSCFS